MLVAQERRSFVAPYGPMKYRAYKNTPEDRAESGRIAAAVMAYETAANIPAAKAVTDTDEDGGDAWIIHRRTGWGTDSEWWVYRVDKRTYKVTLVNGGP